MKRLTMKHARATLAPLGMTIKRTEWEEFRVNVANGREETAYYATDLEDALLTGIEMAKIEARIQAKHKQLMAQLG
jgi:hypothetical protein